MANNTDSTIKIFQEGLEIPYKDFLGDFKFTSNVCFIPIDKNYNIIFNDEELNLSYIDYFDNNGENPIYKAVLKNDRTKVFIEFIGYNETDGIKIKIILNYKMWQYSNSSDNLIPDKLDKETAGWMLEQILDTLSEVGNGTEDKEVHQMVDMLFAFRDRFFNYCD